MALFEPPFFIIMTKDKLIETIQRLLKVVIQT